MEKGDRALLGVSGGQDSMVLLTVISRIFASDQLGAFYFDHGLRAAASHEKSLVERYSRKLGVRFFTDKAPPSWHLKISQSLEEAARKLRYEAAHKIIASHSFRWFVTAHHRRDLAETVLMKLITGAGLASLSPIQERGAVYGTPVLRPFLEVSKEEIRSYARRHHIPWVEDESNADPKFLRNLIRQEVLPYLSQLARRNIEEGLARSAHEIQQDLEFLEKEAEGFFKKVVLPSGHGSVMIREEVCHLPPAVSRRILRKVWKTWIPEPYSGDAAARLFALFSKKKGKREVFGSVVAERRKGGVSLSGSPLLLARTTNCYERMSMASPKLRKRKW